MYFCNQIITSERILTLIFNNSWIDSICIFTIKLLHMKEFLPLFLITSGFLAFVFVGIGIKILLKKNGKFAGTCASQNPLVNKEGEVCGICGAKPKEKCENEETE